MDKREKLKRCQGCRNNRYNMPAGWKEGPNDAPVDGTGCYMFSSARACHKEVYYSPGDVRPTLRMYTLDCWTGSCGGGKVVTLKEHKENEKKRDKIRRSY
jgi:hypothetical protein